MKAATESEYAVVGALLFEPSAVAEIDLSPADFTARTCGQAFEAIQALVATGTPVDLATVSQYLHEQTGQNWSGPLSEMMEGGCSPANVPAYAESIRRASTANKVRSIGRLLQEDPEKAEQAIGELLDLHRGDRRWDVPLRDAVKSLLDTLDQGEDDAIPTGYADIDKSLGGWKPGSLYVIGARPAMGKTALMVNMLLRCSVPAGFVSAEQSAAEIAGRALSIQGRVSAHGLRLRRLSDDDWPKLASAAGILAMSPIKLLEKPAPSITEVMQRARRWVHRDRCKIVFIDYVQRLKGDKRVPRHEEVAQVVMGLKELARELQVPVVALAQVNRAVANREDQRPRLDDLKDSGSIEQEADVVMTLYRDAVVNPDSQMAGYAELNVAKNRHGPTGRIFLTWVADQMRFENSL